jgi:hypothetical protein
VNLTIGLCITKKAAINGSLPVKINIMNYYWLTAVGTKKSGMGEGAFVFELTST